MPPVGIEPTTTGLANQRSARVSRLVKLRHSLPLSYGGGGRALCAPDHSFISERKRCGERTNVLVPVLVRS